MELEIYDRFKARRVRFFSDFQLSLNYDKFGSTFSFSFYFDPENPEHKELACVTHFHDCKVTHGGETLVTGFAIGQGFTYEPAKSLATISGYSKPGLFEDCQIPPELYPLQSNNFSLTNIAQRLVARWSKWKIGLIVDPSVADRAGKAFKNTKASETETISSYLTNLAQQKRIVISHDENGNLLLTEAKTEGEPFLDFDPKNGLIPMTGSTLNYDGQGMHSHITVMKQSSADGGNAGQVTIRNPYAPILYRPAVVTQTSGDDIDTNEAAMRELAKEIESGILLTIKTDRWEIDGKIIKPNGIITIIAPELYIYTKSRWFVRSIDFVGNAESTTATLNCVIPEAFNGKMPTSIFAGINMHP